ncbi:MAG: thymidine phosphorylase [Geminicoccaceae bacterium]
MLPQEIIRAKRDGRALTTAEIAAFVAGITDGSVVDAQVGAFAMAVLLRGMDRAETVALTLAMRDSGEVLRWGDLPGPVVDKHSTGGIGDKVSLVLAPLLAACGAYVPMLSGRGLGHSGGTLDKLESLAGYDTRPDVARLERVVREVGCAIVGQTAHLAPADRRLYAIRDVTATVESIPLITASILSKKLAAAPQALVMDVKAGSGAFMPTLDSARALAASIASVAEGAGLRCNALLTDMDQCLGRTAGNALEVGEALAMLRAEPVDGRLYAVTLALAGEALHLARLCATVEEGEAMAADRLADGSAAERFGRMVAALGGPDDVLERGEALLPKAPIQRPVFADGEGIVAGIDARRLGIAIVGLGGGRARPEDRVDPSVGLSEVAGIGDPCGPEAPLAVIHARDEAGFGRAEAEVRAAFRVAAAAAEPGSPVIERVRGAELVAGR